MDACSCVCSSMARTPPAFSSGKAMPDPGAAAARLGASTSIRPRAWRGLFAPGRRQPRRPPLRIEPPAASPRPRDRPPGESLGFVIATDALSLCRHRQRRSLKSEALKPTLTDGGQEEDLAMMRALIVLSLAATAAYMLIPAGEEREWNAGEKASTARLDPLPQDPLPIGERKLRSWGSTLKSLGSDSQGRVAAPQQPSISATLKQEALYQPDGAAGNEASQAAPNTGARPVGETAAPAGVVY